MKEITELLQNVKSEFGRREERSLFAIKDTFQQHLIFFLNVVVQAFFNLREFSDNISHLHKAPCLLPVLIFSRTLLEYFLDLLHLGLLPTSSTLRMGLPAPP